MTKSFQKFSTTVNKESLHDEKFDILLEPLNKSWYISTSSQQNVSLSGFTAILKRSSTTYLTNTYLPTALLTLASLIGFLIPVDMVPGRMALLVTIFLMLVNIRSTEKRTGPVVSKPTFEHSNQSSLNHTLSLKHFQTRHLTAMDIWLLLCMMCVALATFEYAVMLAIRFGKGKKINPEGGAIGKKEEKCNKVDRISLRLFLGIYILTVGSYFYSVATQSK